MRSLMIRSLSVCLYGAIATQAITFQPRVNQTPEPNVLSYVNINGSEHASKAESLIKQGYRIISLSAYGAVSNVNYAAIWVKRDGNSIQTVQGVNLETFNQWVDSWRQQGYISTEVSATGLQEEAVFAGVMEKNEGTEWQQHCDLADPKSAWEYASNHTSGRLLIKGFRMYGTPGNRRYCMLGHENVGNQPSRVFYTTNYTIDYESLYKGELTKRFWRPTRIFYSEDLVKTPQFMDTDVGKWDDKGGLTTEELESEIETQAKRGLYPIGIQGARSGSDARFTVVFGEHDVPSPRKWTANGNIDGFKDPAAATSGLDSMMQTWMKKNGVRQAQMAVAREGVVVAERSFTWAEDNRAVVKHDDIFLLASVSKMFVHAAVASLFDAGKLKRSDNVYPLLGYKKTADPRTQDITVEHLLDHMAGYDREKTGDVAFGFRRVAKAQSNNARAATLRDMIEYMAGQQLSTNPGSSYSYSNYGTMLLSYLVENVTEVPYLDFLRDNILQGLDVQLYATAAEKHAHDRIVQESSYAALDAAHPASQQPIAAPFGGDGAVKEECAGGFSLAASASTIAKFIGKHAVWGTGGRAFANREGSLAGARAFARSSSKSDWAINFNTREFLSDSEFTEFINLTIPTFLNEHVLK